MKKVSHLLIPIVAVVMACVLALTGCAQPMQNAESFRDHTIDEIAITEIIQIATDNNQPEVGSVASDRERPSEQTKPAGEETYGKVNGMPSYDLDKTVSADEAITQEEAYSFGIYETAYKISTMGYDVYRGAAVTCDNRTTYGLVFTEYETNADGNLTGGFLELIEKGGAPTITKEDVEAGVVAVADSDYQTDGIVVDRFVNLKDSSGIYGDYYFKSEMASDYTVSISVEDSRTAIYNEDIDCIDYNTGKTLWLEEAVPTMSFSAESLYEPDELAAYNTAVKALQEIVALQNSNAYESEYSSLVIIETDLLEAVALGEQNGLVGTEEKGYFNIESLNEIELKENQILMVTAENGVQVLTIPTAEELKAASDVRVAKGFISIVGGALLAVGSVAICVFTCGAAAPAVTAVCIIAGTVATTYAVSNIVEGISDVYYGVKGDLSSRPINPVKDLLTKAIGDEKTANIIYHATGITASIIQALVIPANIGLSVANSINAGVGQTVLIITRAVAVEVVKMAVTAGVSYLASIGLSRLTTNLTGSEAAGMIVGFGGALLTGFVAYKGLTLVDRRFNFSGLYTKVSLGKVYSDTMIREQALKHFNEAEWNKMSFAEKKSAIEEVARVVANELGLDNPPRIKYYSKKWTPKSQEYGYYYDGDNTLNINTYCLSNGETPWIEIVDTIAHETRHAWQYARLRSGIWDDITDSYVHYISHSTDPKAYYTQPCEADAFKYGEYWAKLLEGVLFK